jgi:hypothetical protein
MACVVWFLLTLVLLARPALGKGAGGRRPGFTSREFDVDLDIVWQIITHDLPPLASALERILVQEDS